MTAHRHLDIDVWEDEDGEAVSFEGTGFGTLEDGTFPEVAILMSGSLLFDEPTILFAQPEGWNHEMFRLFINKVWQKIDEFLEESE